MWFTEDAGDQRLTDLKAQDILHFYEGWTAGGKIANFARACRVRLKRKPRLRGAFDLSYIILQPALELRVDPSAGHDARIT